VGNVDPGGCAETLASEPLQLGAPLIVVLSFLPFFFFLIFLGPAIQAFEGVELLVMSSDDSMYQDEELPPVSTTEICSVYSYSNLIARIALLEEELERLRREPFGNLKHLSNECFHALTGFPSFQEAWNDFNGCGGETVFGLVGRHSTFLPKESVDNAARTLKDQFPGFQGLLDRAQTTVSARRSKNQEKTSRSGRPVHVEPFALFLLPFMYVYGGALESWSEFLPGISCSSSHFSRLLQIATPLVCKHWVPLYYSVRNLNWARANATPHMERTQYSEDRHFCPELREADIVCLLDGLSVRMERSSTIIEQKHDFDWSKDKEVVMRSLVLCNLRGSILHITQAVGGRTFEVAIAEQMTFLDMWNTDATSQNLHTKVHLVVDRGFHDYVQWIQRNQEKWPFLTITTSMPSFLNPVKHRGERYTAEEKANKRTQFDGVEAQQNREIASVRWVNEASVGQVEACHLFKRVLDLSILHHVNHFLKIAAALANRPVGTRNKRK
jgi:uncharacterized small protein (DUF1192 family)